jgi:hypothetical protein
MTRFDTVVKARSGFSLIGQNIYIKRQYLPLDQDSDPLKVNTCH